MRTQNPLKQLSTADSEENRDDFNFYFGGTVADPEVRAANKRDDELEALKRRQQELLDAGNEAAANSIGARIAEIEGVLPSAPREKVTAEPTTDAGNEPVPEKNAPALGTTPPVVTPEPITPKPEPVQTEPVQPEPDETEKMFQEYARTRSAAEKELSEFEAGRGERESNRAMTTGIAGALQAFGEGLAAITGGSAKPLQTGAATLRSVGEQQAAAEEQKGKTLRERILQARQPLEQKIEEGKFRDVFEKRQKEKNMADPASKESVQARELANNFLDAYISSVSTRTDETQLAKLEAIRPRLEKLNANQVKDFMDNLNKLKFTESKSEIEATKAEGKVKTEETKRGQKLQDVADKEFSTDSKKLVETVDGLKRFQQRIGIFQNDVKLALAGDKEENKAAAKRVVQNQGAVSYLIARQDEPKGVFTEQDYAVLNRLGNGLTWSQQLQNWTSKGFRAEYAPDALKNLDDILDQLEFTKQDPSELVKNYKKIYELSDNPYKKEYANRFDKVIDTTPKSIKPEIKQPSRNVVGEFKTEKEVQDAVNSGKIKLKRGDTIKVNGELRIIQ